MVVIGRNGEMEVGITDTKGYKLAVGGTVIAERLKSNLNRHGLTMLLNPGMHCHRCRNWRPILSIISICLASWVKRR